MPMYSRCTGRCTVETRVDLVMISSVGACTCARSGAGMCAKLCEMVAASPLSRSTPRPEPATWRSTSSPASVPRSYAREPKKVKWSSSAQRREGGTVGLAGDLETHHRLGGAVRAVSARDLVQLAVLAALHAQHRMQHGMDGVARAQQLHADGVHQERHVVGDDLHYGMGRLPAVLVVVRVVDVHRRFTGSPALGQAPMTECRAV